MKNKLVSTTGEKKCAEIVVVVITLVILGTNES